MNKELEEAIKFLKLNSEFNSKIDNLTFIKITRESFLKTKQSIETILNYIENSISKETIKEKIKVLENSQKKS